MSVRHWDSSLQPRQKAITVGFESLSDSELLAIILHSGYKGVSSVQMANVILNQVGGLAGLSKMSIKQLMKLKGVKLAKATTIASCIEIVKRMKWQDAVYSQPLDNSNKLVEWLKDYIGMENKENLIVIFLNSNNQVIAYRKVAIGSKSYVMVDNKAIFLEAVKCNASAIFLAHNHPSGKASPSNNDIKLTEDLLLAANIIGIPILDHIIVTNSSYYSFKQHDII